MQTFLSCVGVMFADLNNVLNALGVLASLVSVMIQALLTVLDSVWLAQSGAEWACSVLAGREKPQLFKMNLNISAAQPQGHCFLVLTDPLNIAKASVSCSVFWSVTTKQSENLLSVMLYKPTSWCCNGRIQFVIAVIKAQTLFISIYKGKHSKHTLLFSLASCHQMGHSYWSIIWV